MFFVLALGLAGMAKGVFDTASFVCMQESVPARLRGRVFAF
jgi:hypothetical protein